MSVSIIGYSERGMIGAISADISHAADPLTAVQEFLRLFRFPFVNNSPIQNRKLVAAKILIEQSFSDFGDPDVTILLDDAQGEKHIVFIEAKVHTDVRKGRSILKRWEFFQNYLVTNERGASSLFTQVYRKQRLLRYLSGYRDLEPNLVSRRWSVGRNRVVRRAVDECEPYSKSGWIGVLLPEGTDEISPFFDAKLKPGVPSPCNLQGWETQNWGYSSWSLVEQLANQDQVTWGRTVESFKWNREQIYCRWDECPPNEEAELP
jgi:hypothetical protein